MRTAITLGTPRKGGAQKLLADESIPIQRQLTKLKDFKRNGTSKEFVAVEVWSSDAGRIGYAKLALPPTLPSEKSE